MRASGSRAVTTVAVLLVLPACATKPPTKESRLGERVKTTCHALAFDPAGQHLATVCDVAQEIGWTEVPAIERRLEVFDVQTGLPAKKLVFATAEGFWGWRHFASLAYSPDGRYLGLAGFEAPPRLWETSTYLEQPVPETPADAQGSTAVAYSPDSRYMAIGYLDNAISIHELADPGNRIILNVPSGYPVTALAFSPDGSVLAASVFTLGDGVVGLWDWRGKEVLALLEHDRAVTDIAFSRDGTRLFSLSEDLQVWKLPRNVALSENGQPTLAERLRDSPAPALESAALISVELWAKQFARDDAPETYQSVPRFAMTSDDALIAVAAAEHSVILVDSQTLDTVARRSLSGYIGRTDADSVWDSRRGMDFPDDVEFSPDDRRLAIVARGVHVINAKTGVELLPDTVGEAATDSK